MRRLRVVLLVALVPVAALAVAALKAARRPPDVIVVVADTLRADRVGPGTRGDLTPFLDSLAARGVRFTRAYAASSWTLPSVASLFTSRYPSQHGVNAFDARLRDDEVTVNERLRDRRYAQAGFVANFRLDAAHGFGQGFDAWFPFVGAEGEPLDKPRAPMVAARALAFLDEVMLPRGWRRLVPRPPFFLYFHLMEPHAPYLPPPDAVARVGVPVAAEQARALNTRLLAHDWDALGPAEVGELVALYDGEVAALDAALRTLFTGLARRGLLDRAVVVVTADHGEEFREHGQLGHGQSLYEELLHVPLVVLAPGAAAGRDVDAPISLVDLAPTLLDLAGVAPEPRFVGRSRAAWLARPPMPEDVLAELLPNGTRSDPAIFSHSRKYFASNGEMGTARSLSPLPPWT